MANTIEPHSTDEAAKNRIAQDRIERLHALTAALSESLTLRQVTDAILKHSVDGLGARAGSVTEVSADQQNLEVIAWRGYSAELMAVWQSFPISAPTMLGECVRCEEGIWVENRDALTTRFPHIQPMPDYHAWVALPLIANGQTVGAIGLSFVQAHHFDASERAYMMTLAHYCAQAVQRARLYQAEADARAEAEQANQTKNRFLAMISHELRTPLGAILGFSNVLADNSDQLDAPTRQRFLELVFQEAQRMAGLVDQLLDGARLQAGNFHIALEPLTVAALFDDADARLRLLAAQHPLIICCAPDLPDLLADRGRIVQVLSNLVENAANHSPDGTPIEIAVDALDTSVRFSVSDRGTGIPPEERALVFEAFRQAHTSAGHRGLGLGLAICKGIVEAHGGNISIEANEPVGTIVRFLLPVASTTA